MKVVDLSQRSQDWLTWREAGLGSSDAPVVLGRSPWKTLEELYAEKRAAYLRSRSRSRKITPQEREELMAIPERPERDNSSMARGRALESEAREWYEETFGFPVEPVCGHHEVYEWCKVSLDGWHEDLQICVEIKCPNKKDHFEALKGKVPAKYVPQVDHQLLVSGGRMCHYVSYSPQQPRACDRLAYVEVPRDEGRLQELLDAERAFWSAVVHGVPPKEVM